MSEDLPLTIPALMRQHLRERPDKVLLACDDVRLTYAEADTRSRRLARGLVAAGATKGSHIALLAPAGADFLVTMLAAGRIGAVLVPLSTLSTPDELAWLLANSDSNFLIAAQGFRSQRYTEALKAAIPELDYWAKPPVDSVAAPWLHRIWFTGEAPEGFDAGWSLTSLEAMADLVSDAKMQALEDRVSPADRFVILHTSGSTGKPKGVMHQQGTTFQHMRQVNAVRRLTETDVFFTTFPWFWTAGFTFGLMGVLLAGAEIVWSNSTVASETLDLIERERVTFTNGFWRAAVRLTEDPSYAGRDLTSIRRGNLWPLLAEEIRPKDPMLRHDIYGMSEAGPGVTQAEDDVDLPEHQRGSVGKVLPCLEWKVVDPDTEELLGPGQEGELWLRGPFMTEGYYGKPRSAVYRPDGWYRTADIIVVDQVGYVYVRGRRSDIIKTAGVNVAPLEVQAVLTTMADNQASLVLGVPDEERGQLVVGVVMTTKPVDEADLRKRMGEKLSTYKVPRRILAMPATEIPLLPNGKFDMPKLTVLVQERLKQPVGA